MSLSSEIVNVSRASAKPMFVYESFARSRARAASVIAAWSKASSGGRVRACQAVSAGAAGGNAGGGGAGGAGGEPPRGGVPARVAPRLELLEVRHLAHVHLRREVAADRLL